LVHEVEEHKSIYFEQQNKIKEVNCGIEQHGRLADEKYDYMERKRE
jgi:hypothetical protein